MAGKIKYTRRATDKGWLMVGRAKVGTNDKGVGICEYMKVELTREAQGLVYFKILDDNSGLVRAGEECFLHKAAADKYLSDIGPVGQPAIVRVQYGEKTKQIQYLRRTNLTETSQQQGMYRALRACVVPMSGFPLERAT